MRDRVTIEPEWFTPDAAVGSFVGGFVGLIVGSAVGFLCNKRISPVISIATISISEKECVTL